MFDSSNPDLPLAIFCFCFSVFYLAIHIIRLAYPVASWRFDSRGRQAKALLEASDKFTAKTLAEAVSAKGCLERLLHAQDLSEPEQKLRFNLYLRVGLIVICLGLIAYVRFTPDSPELSGSYATDALICAIGSLFSVWADHRIFRTMWEVAPAPVVEEKHKEESEDENQSDSEPHVQAIEETPATDKQLSENQKIGQ